jgi:hypothetical protein
LPGETEETRGNLSQYSRSQGRDLNPGPPECEVGALTIPLQRSVRFISIATIVITYVAAFNLVPYMLRFHCGKRLDKCLSNCGPRTTNGPWRSAGCFGRKSIAKILSDTERMKMHPHVSMLKLRMLVDFQQKVGE